MFHPGLQLTYILLVASRGTVAQNLTGNLRFVDMLVGASNGGNVFAGASLPYGMAKAVADTNSGSNQGGFTLDGSNVTGFSTMHDSGTGGSPSLGNFPLFPYSSCPGGPVDNCVFPKKERVRLGSFNASTVVAEPGYFSITLDSGIQADMTTTHHTSLFKFTFPPASGSDSQPLILQDLTDLSDTRQDNGTVSVDASTGRITGSGRFSPSFGVANYVLYFCTDFSGADILDNGIFVNSRASASVKNLTISRSINGYPLPGGAFVTFASAANPIYARTATSFISIDQACAHAESEIPDFDLDRVRAAARGVWADKLSHISIDTTGVNESYAVNFFSGYYRTMINPQNYTGENPLWSSTEPYFDSFYCLWDSFRSQIPFLTIVDPSAVEQMLRSLIDTYLHLGWLPDCRMSLSKGFTQGGSNADNLMTDGYLKGLLAGIDWELAYEAVVKDAEVEPYDWCCNGRGGLDSWKAVNYIPVQDFDYKGFGTMTRSVSRTLEYSYNDFCISELAAALGKTDGQEKYLETSGYWKNLFKADQTSFISMNNTSADTGFVGFFQPKFLNQTWGFQDPLKCSNIDTSNAACSLTNNGLETYESSLWEYGFFVPHDQASLISLYGGPDDFVRRLDYLHDQRITYIGNEPAFLTVFQYHYAGRPGLSAKRSHLYIPAYFRPTPDGLPGNDDSGAMGSFLAFAMMGLFPNPGQDVYLITPPYFASINITSPVTGRTAVVRNQNFDPSYTAVFIQSATLDGKPYTKNWLDHSFFTHGKELVLTLGPTESTWGTAIDDLPPSASAYATFNGTGGAGGRNRARRVARTYEAQFGKLGPSL